MILEGFEALSHPGSKAEKKRWRAVRFSLGSEPHDPESDRICVLAALMVAGRVRLVSEIP
jgi:hypothetical protein